jgi:tRNA pseudouridine55 synthase
MDGFLLVDKPVGISSFGVVAKIKRLIRDEIGQKVKIGHTGTLDPLASGLLILVLGSYTKKAQEFSKMAKTYEVELILGATSATGDGEGPITKVSRQEPKEEAIKKVLKSFIGEINQTPHAHSAVKVGGQRAYKLARAGKEFKIEPRKVTIYSIEKIDYKYPKLNFITEVSSGTYIRSLAEDIGQKLGTGAYVLALRRTKVGGYNVQDAVSVDELTFERIFPSLLPPLPKML